MPRMKLTLGYPTLRAAVMALHGEGLKPAAIAARIGVPTASVYSALSTAQIASRRPTEVAQPEAGRVPLTLSADVIAALDAAATARGVPRATLAARLVATIARDGLWDAVLDDDGGVR